MTAPDKLTFTFCTDAEDSDAIDRAIRNFRESCEHHGFRAREGGEQAVHAGIACSSKPFPHVHVVLACDIDHTGSWSGDVNGTAYDRVP